MLPGVDEAVGREGGMAPGSRQMHRMFLLRGVVSTGNVEGQLTAVLPAF